MEAVKALLAGLGNQGAVYAPGALEINSISPITVAKAPLSCCKAQWLF
jgi:hypothetical protein